MIDLSSETLIPIRDVPKCLPKRSNSKRIHISAIYRWIQSGVRGVRLESIKVGGSTYTSREAIQRFSGQLSRICEHGMSRSSRSRRRQRQIEQATRQVEAILENR